MPSTSPEPTTAIGHHRYTDQDLRTTLGAGRTLFDLLPGGFPPSPQGAAAIDDLALADPAAAVAMHHRHGPVSRMYATVVEPGTIIDGDAVQLEPDR